jgi:hypothetical protein
LRQPGGMQTRQAYPLKCLPEIIPTLAAKRAAKHGHPLNQYLEDLVLREAGQEHGLTEPVYVEAAAIARVGGMLSDALGSLSKNDVAEAKRLMLIARRECFDLFKKLQTPVAAAEKVRSQQRYTEQGGEGSVAAAYLVHEDYDHVPDGAD